MKSYYQVRLGRGGMYAQECLDGNFIGVDYGIHQDLTHKLPEVWREFNKVFIPVLLERDPDRSKISAGLACGAIWTVSKGLKIGDIVLCPDSNRRYHIGEITGDYHYHPDGILPHRRTVAWFDQVIDREDLSEALRSSTNSTTATTHITKYAEELERLIDGNIPPALIATDESVEDPSAFAMEKHLEDFLVQNWDQTELAAEFEIYQEDGELVGQQYPTDTGPIDIFAVSRDEKTLLVIELKKGRASDAVVGQILRYMGFVQEELAEEGQQVKGIIIALEDDPKLRRALVVVPSVDFYRYQVSFQLIKG
jgi:restriction system protein